MKRFCSVVIVSLIGVAMDVAGHAGGRSPHPVIGWGGNEYLFEVSTVNLGTQLTGYRAVGSRWERVGTTTIRRGQRRAEQGFLQKIWFQGRRLGTLDADMNNSYWRVFPGQEHGGGSIWP